jgi:hypothetical protein
MYWCVSNCDRQGNRPVVRHLMLSIVMTMFISYTFGEYTRCFMFMFMGRTDCALGGTSFGGNHTRCHHVYQRMPIASCATFTAKQLDSFACI